jgi:hypothetical protein
VKTTLNLDEQNVFTCYSSVIHISEAKLNRFWTTDSTFRTDCVSYPIYEPRLIPVFGSAAALIGPSGSSTAWHGMPYAFDLIAMQSTGISSAAESVVDRQMEREQPVSLAPAAPPAPRQPEAEDAQQEQLPATRQAANHGGASLEFAVFGGLLAGAAGIVKATQMQRPVDILLCLLGSLTGCGLVCYFYFRRE